jgi:glycosyltransferase involved in cell wall biosynthesis
VIIPVHNGGEFIAAAIESVKAQSYKGWELVVVDDGSSDNTAEIVSTHCSDRIVLVRQENMGDEAARVRAMVGASTDYIARLDADDLMLPSRLEQQITFMDTHRDVGILGGQIMYTSEDGKRCGFRSWWPCEHEEILRLLLAWRGAICNPTLMVRCDVSSRMHWPGPGIPGKDYGYALEMSRRSKLANLREVVNLMRIHKNSIQSRKDPSPRLTLEAFYLARYHQEEKGLPLVGWDDFRLRARELSWHQTIGTSWNMMIGRAIRRAMWLWLNRSPKALSWPWFVLAGVLGPHRVLQRLLRRIRAGTR